VFDRQLRISSNTEMEKAILENKINALQNELSDTQDQLKTTVAARDHNHAKELEEKNSEHDRILKNQKIEHETELNNERKITINCCMFF
jgi:hypothetical protein